MLPSPTKSKVFIVGGLLFGDEGKGTTVESLTQKFDVRLVIRYNGGPQAMHHVVFQDKTFHCFSQFGSGSFFPLCHTLLTHFMVISPHTLLVEMEYLRRKGVLDIEEKLFIDKECVIVTPMHKLINRLLETLRSKGGKYGTTGMGVGVTIDDKENKDITSLKVKDMNDDQILYGKLKKIMVEKLKRVKEIMECFKKDQKSVYEIEFMPGDEISEGEVKLVCDQANKFVHEFLRANTVDSLFEFYRQFGQKFNHCFIDSSTLIQQYLSKGYNIIMEGAQGALLDKIHGFYPHITKSLCSAENALNLLRDINKDSIEIIKVGVLRVYSSRHGNGPFISHEPLWGNFISEEHNSGSGWQGDFRIGPFDFVAAKYGVEIFKPDVLSLTCLDKIVVAAGENLEIAKFPVVLGYKNKNNYHEIKEDLFVYDKNKEVVEGFVKRKEEEAWKSMDLVKTMRNMEGVIRNIGEDKDLDGESKLREVVENECRKKFKKIGQKNHEKMGKFIALIEKKLGVPVKIISFGASVHDKIYLD